MSESFHKVFSPRVKPFQRKPLTKGRIMWAIEQTRSLTKSSELCDVCYPTFRKYAKLYKDENGISLFEKYKNQSGKGIPKKRTKERNRFGVLASKDNF